MNRWMFTGADGTFRLERANRVRGMYFPVANEAGYMASITPDGGGDATIGLNHFLMPPVSVVDLHNSRLKRTAWVCATGGEPWSATGASHAQKHAADEAQTVEAGLLWHKSTRAAASGAWEAETLVFAPPGDERLELQRMTIRNTGNKPLSFTLIPVYPLYGRSADSLRDHRHVTSLLNRVHVGETGVYLTPTMSFDERGHKQNTTVYAVLGRDSAGNAPRGCFPDLDRYIGEAGDAERPEVIYDTDARERERRVAGDSVDGTEALGALEFPQVTIAPGKAYATYLIAGVFASANDANAAAARYCSADRFDAAFEANRTFWRDKTSPVLCSVGDSTFEQWMRWVTVQPVLRRLYGNSFLPYHDYGRGGRGWRDLWQDCLALLLMEPDNVRSLLLSNFAGVRFDGTNATIIGTEPGSFLADRNSIPRVWMDHGAWPVLTVKLYVDQSGDLAFLNETQRYFTDVFWARAKERVPASSGTVLKTQKGDDATGTVFEHMLLQQLSVFFNVGDHNCLLLEGADWNDGLDMAHDRGESVAFTSLYASNLLWLAEAAERLEAAGTPVELATELTMLLDRYSGNAIDYADPAAKRALLSRYFASTAQGPGGDKTQVDAKRLAADLREKAEDLFTRVREQEWVEDSAGHGWFNGYYDNTGKRVEGEAAGGVRMTLTGQVFSLLSCAATETQVERVVRAADHYLYREEVGGYRLNTKFGEGSQDLGRCFAFAYGHKENGAMFSHMAVMYAYALYARGRTQAGWKVLRAMYNAAANFERSRMYPGVPEYFEPDGRGVYCYLTGSASWYLLTVVTQMFGVRGSWGDLILAPQLTAEQWGSGDTVAVATSFAGRQLRVEYENEAQLEAGRYTVAQVAINGNPVEFTREGEGVRIQAASLPAGDLAISVELRNT